MLKWRNWGLIMLLSGLVACHQTPSEQIAEEKDLREQKQGYPVLIAMPVVADYALPFCEKAYCIDVEIFSFKSQDEWFNHYTNQQIADRIRQQLGLSQKLSLQRAINEFITLSDNWQAEHLDQKAWMMYIKPRVALQQNEIALLVISTEYHLGEGDVPEQKYFYVVDRKAQKTLRLYDLVNEDSRTALMDEIQHHFQLWQDELTDVQKQKLPEKLYWANQDWFFDEQGIAIYYRAKDLGLDNVKDFTIYLTPDQAKLWVKDVYIQQLNLR